MKCCICGKEFTGYGNNPYPTKQQGRCCDKCNTKIVIPARLASIGISSKRWQKQIIKDITK